GHSSALDEVETRTPASLAEISALPGLGPKRVRLMRERLGITTLRQLEQAARAGRLRSLPRFGEALEAKILAALAKGESLERRFKISTAEDFAAGLVAHMKAFPGARQ